MNLSARLSAADRFQKSRLFRIIATAVILLGVGGGSAWVVLDQISENQAAGSLADGLSPDVFDEEGNRYDSREYLEATRIQRIIDEARSPVSMGIGLAIGLGVLVLCIWMGLGLTYLGIAIVSVATCFAYLGLHAVVGARGDPMPWIIAIGGGFQLTFAFIVLLRAVTLLFSFSHPVLAIARNVLAEAVRMKISLIFIVMLVLMLFAMPLVLTEDQPLRYRVQNFLSTANGATFWIVALLVMFFGVATVAFEQRDKIIWQTMTKPVGAWRYVLGKWLGVVTLAAILLAVSAVGVFGFTEYLKRQPAIGEIRAYEPVDGQAISEDRRILETQVLTAVRTVRPMIPFNFQDPSFTSAVDMRIEELQRLGAYTPTSADRTRFRIDAFNEAVTDFRSIDPRTERYQTFDFPGLLEAKRLGEPVQLTYIINAEGNRPDIFYGLTFVFPDGTPVIRERTGLGFEHSFPVSTEFIDERGVLSFQLYNGALALSNGEFMVRPNTNSINIPSDGLGVSYRVGSFRGNFLRVCAVQWVKLAFIAMLAVWAGTFLNFPVACLVTGGVFYMAESAGWVASALGGWGTTTAKGEAAPFRAFIYHFSDFVSTIFVPYSELEPTERLTNGRVLGWGDVSAGTLTLLGLAVLFYGFAVLVFRKRELAIYSGQ